MTDSPSNQRVALPRASHRKLNAPTGPSAALSRRLHGAFSAVCTAAAAGAVVSIEGTALSEVTNRTGRFQINRVPVGTRSLKIVYPGLDPATQSIVVVPGQNTVPPVTPRLGRVSTR